MEFSTENNNNRSYILLSRKFSEVFGSILETNIYSTSDGSQLVLEQD